MLRLLVIEPMNRAFSALEYCSLLTLGRCLGGYKSRFHREATTTCLSGRRCNDIRDMGD